MASCFLGTARDELIRVLERLIERDSGAFVVVDVKGTSRFVQFAGSRDDPLIVDVPTELLSAEEVERARDLFAALDNAVPSDWGFQADCRRSPLLAAELGIRVLREVLLVDDNAELVMDEN